MNIPVDQSEVLAQRDPLRIHLAGLPIPEASTALWSRIERTRQRRRLRRQLAATGAVAAVAMIAVLKLSMPDPAQVTQATAAMATAPASEPDLRAIDHQLQSAYDHAADPEQIQALWLAREHATRTAATRSIEDDRIIRL
jgi:cell division protein FtsL